MKKSQVRKFLIGAVSFVGVAAVVATIVACVNVSSNAPKRTDEGVKTLLNDYATYEQKVRKCQAMGSSYSVSYDACVNP